MKWRWRSILGFAILGAGLAWRERRTGHGKIIDERGPIGPQTEADRDAIRAEGSTTHGVPPNDHQ
jgi:hypothetical protein